MENNILIKKMNGMHPIDLYHLLPTSNFHFIEYIDKTGNLNIAFALYYYKGIYYNLMLREYFTPAKITKCVKLTDYVKFDEDFISIQMAEYFKVQYAEQFIKSTKWYKNLLEEHNANKNNV